MSYEPAFRAPELSGPICSPRPSQSQAGLAGGGNLLPFGTGVARGTLPLSAAVQPRPGPAPLGARPSGHGDSRRGCRPCCTAPAPEQLRAKHHLRASGWGECLLLKEIFPETPQINFLEFFYNAKGADIGFDPEFPIQSPWTRRASASRICFDGVDSDAVRPDAAATFVLRSGRTLSRKDEVITYVSRNLEPYRGFHVFMRPCPNCCTGARRRRSSSSADTRSATAGRYRTEAAGGKPCCAKSATNSTMPGSVFLATSPTPISSSCCRYQGGTFI